MGYNQQVLQEKLRGLLQGKRSKSYYAHKLGITIEEVNGLLLEINGKVVGEVLTNKEETHLPNTINVVGYYDYPPKPEDVIRDYKIDITKWRISSQWIKQKEKGWQISVLFTPIKEKDIDRSIEIEKILKAYKSTYKPLPKTSIHKNILYKTPSCALFSLPDLHLDKLTVDKKSIENKVLGYTEVLENLIDRAYSSHNIEEIVFVTGNDFFHSDTFWGTTTKGTPLETDLSWSESYEIGFDLMVKSINKLKNYCNKLHVILIPGNHARTKEYYLLHGLEVYFKPDKNIVFNRGAQDLKVHRYGETLLCFSHGNNVNDKLPLTFATSFYKDWGTCKYKEIILGDKHHNNEKLFRSQGEANGVRMRILPSLSGTDTWHQDNLFVGAIQSGICMVYDKAKGKVSEFEERI